MHKAYNDTTYNNDIAILVLSQPLNFDDRVKPIQLRDPRWELPGRWGFCSNVGALLEYLAENGIININRTRRCEWLGNGSE